jgi:hypothetical protein
MEAARSFKNLAQRHIAEDCNVTALKFVNTICNLLSPFFKQEVLGRSNRLLPLRRRGPH